MTGRPPCYYVSCTINGSLQVALLDLGSEICLLAAENPIVKRMKPKQTDLCVQSISGEPIQVVGRVTAAIQLGELIKDWPFIVVKGMSAAAVLGADLLRSVQQWGVADGEFYIGGANIPPAFEPAVPPVPAWSNQVVADMYSQPTEDLLPAQKATAAKTTVLAKRSQRLVEVQCSWTPGQQLLFEGESLPDGVLLSKTLVSPKSNGTFWVRAVNLNDDAVTLFSNQTVGYVEAAVPVAEGPSESDAVASLSQLGIDLSHAVMTASERR